MAHKKNHIYLIIFLLCEVLKTPFYLSIKLFFFSLFFTEFTKEKEEETEEWRIVQKNRKKNKKAKNN